MPACCHNNINPHPRRKDGPNAGDRLHGSKSGRPDVSWVDLRGVDPHLQMYHSDHRSGLEAHHSKASGAEAVSPKHQGGDSILVTGQEGGDEGEEADGEEAEHPDGEGDKKNSN